MPEHITVVIATYNRHIALRCLLDDLQHQTLGPAAFDVIVVDDGSDIPVNTVVDTHAYTYTLQLIVQQNTGPAAARHYGVVASTGDIVVICDDDMRVSPDFLQQHLAAHHAGATVVLGHICAATSIAHMPLFERFHAYQLERFVQAVHAGSMTVRGVHLCTGNVSFRRVDYMRIGGFDTQLGRSEDRDLGIRLEQIGARLVFCEQAKSTHESDHVSLDKWLKRAYAYGIYDKRIALKHPGVKHASPWAFFFMISPLAKPWMLVPMVAPKLADKAAHLVMHVAMGVDKVGLNKLATQGTTFAYGLEYFRGVRDETPGLLQVCKDVWNYITCTRH